MLEKSCQWCLIWCLLFFCHAAEGQLQWVVKEKVAAYGQNLILLCPVENCCSKPAGWSVGTKSIILDVKTFSNDPKGKYHGTYNKDGFGVVIRNLSAADLNVTYHCVYGFDLSTPKYLLHGDVFKENVPDKDKENDTAAIVVPIVVIMVGFIIGMMAYCVNRSRRPKPKGTNEETEKNNVSDIQMENQPAQQSAQVEPVSGTSGVGPITFQQDQRVKKKPMKSNNENEEDLSTIPQEIDESEIKKKRQKEKGTDEEMEDLNHSDSQMKNQEECFEVEIIQKGPIEIGYGGTIKIDAKIKSNSTTSLKVNWRKTDCSEPLMINCPKYSESSCDVNNPQLVINNVDKEDAGIYKLEVISPTETKSSSGILFELYGEDHIERMKDWKIEDKLFYDETRGFAAVLDMVKSKNYMTIIGGPKSGKTATACHIALQLEKKGWKVVPVCKLENIIEYGDIDHEKVFVLDDLLGIFAVDMTFINYITNHKEQIFTTIGKTSKILLTCRKSVYKEAFKLGLFVTENVVDLQSNANQLTETEKMAICEYHCKAKGVSPYFYASLSFTKANHMFPFLCKEFSREKKYQQLGENFFNKPFGYFINELDILQHKNGIQYAVLVLCLINDLTLSVEYLPHERMQDVFNNCGVNLGTSEKEIIDAIYHMSETYFTKLDTEYTFTHDFIFEAIAYHYGRQNQQQIFKYLSSSYIANTVTVYEQALNEDLCIQISENMYLSLAKRLYTDIQSMNLFDVFMNKSLKHGPFLDVFKEMLKTKPYDEFESLILRKRQNIQHFVNTTFSVKKPNQQKIDFDFDRDRLHLLFGSIYIASDIKYNVRVISWIIYYGHTHLLKEICNHVECNSHSIDLVFGSDVMENTRLLLLGCYSNTLDMVELILRHVDLKCIDLNFSPSIVSYFGGTLTPLISACTIGNLCIVKALLEKHAAINKCNDRNASPLIKASMYGRCDVVKFLLRAGADIDLCDVWGHSPLFVASEKGHCDVVKCLLSYCADVNLCAKNGNSPLCVASMYKHADVVDSLKNVGMGHH